MHPNNRHGQRIDEDADADDGVNVTDSDKSHTFEIYVSLSNEE